MNIRLLSALACLPALAQTWMPQSSGTSASLRGISAASTTTVWASGTGGTWLRTLDGGATWHAAAVPGVGDLDFRAVHGLDANTAWLMSSGPGAKSRLYRTTDGGAYWSLLFTNPDAAGFLDALAFWDSKHGIIVGDPVDGHFAVFTTSDGGQTWTRRNTPPALGGEGAFAASNSCLAVHGDGEAWFATGGPSGARIFHSNDGGQSWTAAETPLRHDGAAAGIFSIAFADRLHGIAVGGDYTQPKEPTGNVALTSDGGRTWSDPAGSRPTGYRCAVAYIDPLKIWIAVGTSGSDFSRDSGRTWKRFEDGSYNALGVAGTLAWAAGAGGRIARLSVP